MVLLPGYSLPYRRKFKISNLRLSWLLKKHFLLPSPAYLPHFFSTKYIKLHQLKYACHRSKMAAKKCNSALLKSLPFCPRRTINAFLHTQTAGIWKPHIPVGSPLSLHKLNLKQNAKNHFEIYSNIGIIPCNTHFMYLEQKHVKVHMILMTIKRYGFVNLGGEKNTLRRASVQGKTDLVLAWYQHVRKN